MFDTKMYTLEYIVILGGRSIVWLQNNYIDERTLVVYDL